MKIKVLQNLQQRKDENKVSKDGRPYKMFTWFINAQNVDNNVFMQNIKVDAFSEKAIELMKPNAIIEVTENNFNGNISYKIELPKANYQNNNFKKPSGSYGKQAELTSIEYKSFCVELYQQALVLSEMKPEIAITIFEKMLNNASFFVKQDSLKTPSIAQENANNIQNTFGGNLVQNNGDFVQQSVSGDEGVPW